ncbi:transcriptional regulator [Bradyrhizobium neotropicale]|uniref:Transcriptional regulator n=2 Tax=Bradyrhizobium neotropicale TaxID=1497615 RepID=A0A176ZGN1_9BRAD|nr:helix-turn-helix domain-containing protein [Bradyrhizobium neotropicale]OAF19647.1 transcriptional regulator [Bradyrhizobium neotropicale]
MSYQSEELIREVQGQRIRAAMSQRALAVRSGLTQAHISQIETGRLEPGLSSFIQMARALDLEVVLVPKKLLPAVEGMLRSTTPEFLAEEGQSALFAKGERLLAKLKKLQGGSAALDRIAEYFRFLKQVRLSKDDVALVEDSIKILRHIRADPQLRAELDNIAGLLQVVRNRIAHPTEAPRPAYALDEDHDA